VIAGLKDGTMMILDVGVGEILEEITGHTTEVWSLSLFPNQVSTFLFILHFTLSEAWSGVNWADLMDLYSV